MAALFTRCPGCQSVYQLTAPQVADGAGTVRCGTCGKTFNALDQLFSGHPDSNQTPLESAGVPPLLRHPAVAQPELPGLDRDATGSIHEEPGPTLSFLETGTANGNPQSVRPAQLAGLILAAVLLAQTAVQWQSPDSALKRWLDPDSSAVLLDGAAGAIQVTSRDMHRHPSLDDAIIISATLRNPTERNLDWPVLEVRLYDPSQQVLGARRLTPQDYLDGPETVRRGMTPEVLTPVILEFVVGTTEPSGFDFRFF